MAAAVRPVQLHWSHGLGVGGCAPHLHELGTERIPETIFDRPQSSEEDAKDNHGTSNIMNAWV